MTHSSVSSLLKELEKIQNENGNSTAQKLLGILKQLRKRTIDDVYDLLRLHELLLFIRAYPQNAKLVAETESQLQKFSSRVKRLMTMMSISPRLSIPKLLAYTVCQSQTRSHTT